MYLVEEKIRKFDKLKILHLGHIEPGPHRDDPAMNTSTVRFRLIFKHACRRQGSRGARHGFIWGISIEEKNGVNIEKYVENKLHIKIKNKWKK
jgi:hypothetical protein